MGRTKPTRQTPEKLDNLAAELSASVEGLRAMARVMRDNHRDHVMAPNEVNAEKAAAILSRFVRGVGQAYRASITAPESPEGARPIPPDNPLGARPIEQTAPGQTMTCVDQVDPIRTRTSRKNRA